VHDLLSLVPFSDKGQHCCSIFPDEIVLAFPAEFRLGCFPHGFTVFPIGASPGPLVTAGGPGSGSRCGKIWIEVRWL